ncbi:MAG: hypothetical protein VXZ38_11810, partial [Planctomycetota bacterium]|nr:hypothetical protein [Planctomycetota bacterium]
LAVLLIHLSPTADHSCASNNQNVETKEKDSLSNDFDQKGPNGGMLQVVSGLQVETVVSQKGIMFLVLTKEGEPMSAEEASGTMLLRIADGDKKYRIQLQSLKNQGIGAAIDLSKLVGKTLYMDVELTGLLENSIQFSARSVLQSRLSDEMLVRLQKTCPVTGKPLGSMGNPPKILVKGKPLFVCCPPCSSKITDNPDPYLRKYYSVSTKKVRPGVFESNLSDADAIAAQKVCLVMNKDLGSMGNPQKVNVDGKSIYICCAGCAKKLLADPEKYLALMADRGIEPPDFK